MRQGGLAGLAGLLALAMVMAAGAITARGAAPAAACFILFDEQAGTSDQGPSEACDTRVTPASTFKIPHAVAALDAGVITEQEIVHYDGSAYDWPYWRRDQTLETAIRYSAVWVFQEIARRLGAERERAYLQRFGYGNRDASGPLTEFWLGSSLQITPAEQLGFLVAFFHTRLGVKADAQRAVQRMLAQPAGQVVNALGEHAFAAPWPPATTMAAKTGAATDRGGEATRWLVGRVARGNQSWIFVSCVIGDPGANAAIDLAARQLKSHGVL